MEIAPGTGLAAFVAGILTVLNPCVLPLLPIVFATAVSKHPIAGPLALAAGLTLSFVAIGLFLALVGYSLGLNAEWFRPIGAVVLIGFGLLLLSTQLQTRLVTAAGPVTNWANQRFARLGEGGWVGQLGLGLLLGVIWSPCAGPTIGVATSLAFGGENLGAMTGIMLVFGVGASIPLVALGFLSRAVLARWRGGLGSAGRIGKAILGLLLVTIGILILTKLDRQVEGWLNSVLPTSLLDLTVRY